MTRFIARLTIAWAGVALLAPAHTEPVSAQEADLPAEVREWLARDQAQRWARMLAEGDSIFNSASCRRCHGEGGSGGSWGPDLTDSTWVQSDGSLEGIRRTIFWGVRRELMSDPDWRFEMNPGGGVDLTWEQYASLAAYVWSLSNGAGRDAASRSLRRPEGHHLQADSCSCTTGSSIARWLRSVR